MTFLHTAREKFDSEGNKTAWTGYLKSGNFTHLHEVVSLDYMLNKNLVVPDYDSEYDLQHVHSIDFAEDVWIAPGKCINQINTYETGLYTTREYVLERTKTKRGFNLLTVAIEPGTDCEEINIDGYSFLGYDLIDQWFENSALTNCSDICDPSIPSDLNNFGLIDNYNKATEIQQRLRKKHPYDGHANTIVIAIWRHNTIGQIPQYGDSD